MEESDLRRDLLTAWDYAWAEDAWVNPLEEALADLTPEQALARVGSHPTCIWEMVLHLAVWNENMVERIETGLPASPSEGHWPPPPASPTSQAWEEAKERLRRSVKSLEETLRSAPWTQITGSSYGLPDLLCRFTHMGYHLGQITVLRAALEEQHGVKQA